VIDLPKNTSDEKEKNFSLRVKLGEQEVELNGTRSEVMKTIQELPSLMNNIQKAFEIAKPKTIATLTVKTQDVKEETSAQKQKYPQINPSENLAGAILDILKSEWGKWRPRTIDELKETLKANGVNSESRILAKVLSDLAQKGVVRRWNTDSGFVFILAEKEISSAKGETA
jgi:hypothetical protein